MPNEGCLLSICGGSGATFVNTRITAVAWPTPLDGSQRSAAAALCISQGSRVTLRNCTFRESSIPPLLVYGNTTSVLLDQCNISNNNITGRSLDVGLTSWNDKRGPVLRSRNFIQDVAQGLSTVGVNGGLVAIQGSTFKGNNGTLGCALHVSNTARVFIQSSLFEGNTAISGGAVYAMEHAKVVISSGEQWGVWQALAVLLYNLLVMVARHVVVVGWQ
jgi:predicted outer membrane repeat protein